MNNKGSKHTSVKHDIISKNNSKVVIIISLTTFLVVFCIFASKALFSQSSYYSRVIKEKKIALKQLEANQEPLNQLAESYKSFGSTQVNIIGGNPTGQGPNDGNNIELTEDSLPSLYDFPALTSSFEKILKNAGVENKSIGGQEDSALSENTSPNGESVGLEIPYSVSVTADQTKTKQLLQTLEKSIRPIYVTGLQIQIGTSTLDSVINLKTFYTQESVYTLGSKEIK